MISYKQLAVEVAAEQQNTEKELNITEIRTALSATRTVLAKYAPSEVLKWLETNKLETRGGRRIRQ